MRRAAVLTAIATVVAALLPFGAASASTEGTFANPAPIVLPLPEAPPGCPSDCPSEKADPYPSTIEVSGMSDTVVDVQVALKGLTYEFHGPADADVMLVAPDGTKILLMSDACGDNDNYNPITSPITLTFDDDATARLPGDARCSSGTFEPLDDDNDEGEFPFHPEDSFPDGPTAPPSTRPLSTFDGIGPNGTWKLYVVDDYPNDPDADGEAGRIDGGWSLTIATGPAPEPGDDDGGSAGGSGTDQTDGSDEGVTDGGQDGTTDGGQDGTTAGGDHGTTDGGQNATTDSDDQGGTTSQDDPADDGADDPAGSGQNDGANTSQDAPTGAGGGSDAEELQEASASETPAPQSTGAWTRTGSDGLHEGADAPFPRERPVSLISTEPDYASDPLLVGGAGLVLLGVVGAGLLSWRRRDRGSG